MQFSEKNRIPLYTKKLKCQSQVSNKLKIFILFTDSPALETSCCKPVKAFSTILQNLPGATETEHHTAQLKNVKVFFLQYVPYGLKRPFFTAKINSIIKFLMNAYDCVCFEKG